MGRRILVSSMDGVEFSGDATSIVDMMFGFYEVGDHGSPENFSTDDDEQDERADNADSNNIEENQAFWNQQQNLLQETLIRTTSLESKIRKVIKEGLKELTEKICICEKAVMGRCKNCLMNRVSEQLLNAGFNSAICKSKWRSSPDIPSGEHSYIDVVDKTSKRGEVRVVVELNFRAEFEMGRASEEYNQLVNRLPEVFVGKAERLRAVIKIICGAAKKCMKERKMHMGPWRKQKYMQAKWFGSYKRTTPTTFIIPQEFTSRLQRPKASMLTFDLLDKIPGVHCTAVKVL